MARNFGACKMASDECCYVCNECPNSFTTLDELEHHIESAHSSVYRNEANGHFEAIKGNETTEHEKTAVEDPKDETMEHVRKHLTKQIL